MFVTSPTHIINTYCIGPLVRHAKKDPNIVIHTQTKEIYKQCYRFLSLGQKEYKSDISVCQAYTRLHTDKELRP